MGLFGWIKKDINLHRRRESAPPLTSDITRGRSHVTRDEAYVDALNKFNEWRSQQRLERISEGHPLESTGRGTSCPNDEAKHSEGRVVSDFSTDLEITSEERKILTRKCEIPKSPRYTRHRQETGVPKKPKRSVEFYRNINRIPEHGEPTNLNNGKNNNAAERHSLPAQMPSGTPRRSKSRLSKPNNNTIYENEIEEFEQMHVKDSLGDTYAVQSPPSRFYKDNSSPYQNANVTCSTNPTIVDSTPKKQVNLLQKAVRCRNFKDKPAPPPPMPASEPPNMKKKHNRTNDTGSDSPFTGSYRNYEINTSSIYDEHVISSRAYRGDMNSFNATNLTPNAKERRKSPSYQTIVNKHGDLVDYALPFSDTNDTQSELNASKTLELINKMGSCEEFINENFRFLNSVIQPSKIALDDSTGMITEPISVLKERAPQIITDLDRSQQSAGKPELTNDPLDEVDLVIHEPQDILLELESLEKWSKSIQMSDDLLQKQFSQKNMLEFFQEASTQLPICWPSEVHYRVGTLRSSFAAPLEFSCGIFRKAPVTLRKYSLNVDRSLYFAEEACMQDILLLCRINHFAVASLMAVCYDGGLNQITLVLEPFDFTLFDYIHKMNKRLSQLHALTAVQQICSAVSYLQECGYIHSNITSGSILMRKYPYAVKLTSFELTTEVSDTIRKEIENQYGSTSSSRNSMTSSQNEELKKITTYSRLIKNDEQFLRDKYRKLSKELSETRKAPVCSMSDSGAYDCRVSRYLPYCKEYREKFSLFYYVAPELLVPKSNFVFPTKSTDVYSLTLLLWETLNGYIPFVVYSRPELEKLQMSSNVQLPIFEKERCDRFRQIFETGLLDLGGRKLSVTDILDTLDCLLQEQGWDKQGQASAFSEDYEEQMNTSEIRKKNELNDIRKQNCLEKTDKKYFQSGNGYVNVESVPKLGRDSTAVDSKEVTSKRTKQQPKKPARKINKAKPEKGTADDDFKIKKSPHGSSFNLSSSAVYQTLFDFNKFLSPRSTKQNIYERTSTVKKHKKPVRMNKKAAKELFEPTSQSERTGSCHKLNCSDSRADLLDEPDLNKNIVTPEVIGPLEVYCKESPAKMNINNQKSKFLKEIIMHKDYDYDSTNELPKADTSKSCDNSPGARRKNTSKLSNSLRFTIGDITLPDTPIARKNKIRKHAWLSDQKLVISDENTSTPVTPQGRRACSFFNNLDSHIQREDRSVCGLNSPLNLNISSSMQDIKPKRVNISVNIIKDSNLGGKTKAYSQEFSKTTPAIIDITIAEPTEQKSESTNNIFEGTLWKKEKAICERTQLRHSTDNIDEEQANESASVITAHLTSVRDAVRKIETTFEDTGFDYSPVRKLESASKKPTEERKISEESTVVEENLLIPTKILELEKTIEQLPVVEEPKTAVTRLDVVLTNNTIKKKEELLQLQQQSQQQMPPPSDVFPLNSQHFLRRKTSNAGSVIQRTVYRESIVSSTDLPGLDGLSAQGASGNALPPGSARKKKLTTRVTVNMRKISRRASDIGTSPVTSRPNSLNLDEEITSSGCLTPTSGTAPIRHSCGNDLLKAFAKLRLIHNNDEGGAPGGGSRSSSRNEDRKNLCSTAKPTAAVASRPESMVCCNCGSSMVPADSLNVPAGSRIGMSAAFSELNFPRESLASMFEDNLGLIQQQQQQQQQPSQYLGVPGSPVSRQALAQAITNAKSTEDLYIDDDFYQGLNLGANMELVEFIDDEHFLNEFGYDIYTTEEIYDSDGADSLDNREQDAAPAPDEEQFLTKCADMNPTNMDAIGSVFSPARAPPEKIKTDQAE